MKTSKSALAGILLAAGGSTRLGRPKQALQLDGESLVHRAASAALPVCTAGLIVVTGAYRDMVMTNLSDLPVAEAHNSCWEEGIGSSVVCGVQAVSAQAAGVLLMVCDQPAMVPASLLALSARWLTDPTRIAASCYAGVLGVPAIFPRAMFCDLLALTGDAGARQLLQGRTDLNTVDLPAGDFDIDEPADLARLESRLF